MTRHAISPRLAIRIFLNMRVAFLRRHPPFMGLGAVAQGSGAAGNGWLAGAPALRCRQTLRSRSMITLYDYLPSQNAYKVRLLLSHLQQPYRTRIISIFEG